MTDILTGTPPELTYLHPLVREAWTVVWAVASGVLVLILGWMGLSLIMQHHLGQTQNGWREMVPRLVLGLVAAATSLWWCALIIDVADAVSGFIAASLGVTAGDLLRTTLRTLLTAVEAGSVGMAIVMALLYMVYGFFVLYVLVQMILRLALIDLLLALAPIALGLWILPHTAGWGRHWLRLFMTTVFQQAVQLIALALGFGFLHEFAGIAAFEPVQDLIWKLLMSVAFIYMATKVPSMLGNHGTFDSWLSTLYFGMNLPGSMVRSAKSIGLIAGGAAGGPGGMAAGAMVAGAGMSSAASGIRSMADMATPSDGGGGGGAPRSAQERRGVSAGRRRFQLKKAVKNHMKMTTNGVSGDRAYDHAEEVRRCAGKRADIREPIGPIATSKTLERREERDLWQTLHRPYRTWWESCWESWGPSAWASSSTGPTCTSRHRERPTRWSGASRP